MRNLIVFFSLLLLCSCKKNTKRPTFSEVSIQTVYQDSVSIRAIEFLDGNTLAFAGSKGIFGTVEISSGTVRTNRMTHDSLVPEFRAVAHTDSDFFMLSVADPALLYKTGGGGKMDLVYLEEGEGVFYDAMKFWNNREGIAVGDTVNGCISIIITRDGGQHWEKVPCDQLPDSKGTEGAFAASNTNIEIIGDSVWIGTTEGRIFYSPDKGNTWSVQQTAIIHEKETEGIYSLDFYDAKIGYAIGGDFTAPMASKNNKMRTNDGGASWQIFADGEAPGYKSCVQFVPGSGGQNLVAVGFTGISYSNNGGQSWQHLSDEGFYTLRFLNGNTAYAAGKNRIAKLTFGN